MKNSDIFKMFSPMLFFLFHVVYLIAWSPDPALNKWIDGSFTFFISLVLCNVIRARLVGKDDRDEEISVEEDGPEPPGNDQAP